MNRTTKIGIAAAVVAAALSCGYFFGRRAVPPQTGAKGQAQKAGYVCPMHPFISKDQPGSCDICGMDLVKRVPGGELSDKELKNVNHVALSPTQQVMANLATTPAAVRPFSKEITATGVVTYNQERQAKVAAWLAGRLDRLLVKSVGAEVSRDRPVAEVYSLDLYNAEMQYLLAYKTTKLLNSTVSSAFPANTQMVLGEAHDRLRQLGFREEEFSRLQKSAKPSVRVPIYSPLSGVVIEKLVQEGQYVNVGDPLFSIADLSRIWVELELFENNLPLVRTGQEVAIVSRSYPGEVFHGRVTFIYPFLNPKTRTVRVRVALPNPGLKLKPDMYVSATIKAPMADSLVVPQKSVMDTGKRRVVWVESTPGVFLPREVTTGARSGGNVQILAGLRAGEKVALTGGYLIDSEAQLTGGSEVPENRTAPPPRKDELDMNDMKMQPEPAPARGR
jgi:Cu(I)/Ag(I) efflux system membrane fusion protein